MTNAAETLASFPTLDARVLAAWLRGLLHESSRMGHRSRYERRFGNLHREDPEIVGQFRINIEDRSFDAMFEAKGQQEGWF